MRNGEVLADWREGEIRFLPSYRRVPGSGPCRDSLAEGGAAGAAGAVDAVDAARRGAVTGHSEASLREWFTLAMKDGGGERTPSYTDRVLTHSLPGMGPELVRSGAYGCAEALTVSDHRPVGQSLTLSVGRHGERLARSRLDNKLLRQLLSTGRMRCKVTLEGMQIVAAPQPATNGSFGKTSTTPVSVGRKNGPGSAPASSLSGGKGASPASLRAGKKPPPWSPRTPFGSSERATEQPSPEKRRFSLSPRFSGATRRDSALSKEKSKKDNRDVASAVHQAASSPPNLASPLVNAHAPTPHLPPPHAPLAALRRTRYHPARAQVAVAFPMPVEDRNFALNRIAALLGRRGSSAFEQVRIA